MDAAEGHICVSGLHRLSWLDRSVGCGERLVEHGCKEEVLADIAEGMPVHSAISTISTPSYVVGSTRWPMRVCTPLRSVWSMRRSPKRCHT